MVQPVEEARKEETWGALSAENIAWLCVFIETIEHVKHVGWGP